MLLCRFSASISSIGPQYSFRILFISDSNFLIIVHPLKHLKSFSLLWILQFSIHYHCWFQLVWFNNTVHRITYIVHIGVLCYCLSCFRLTWFILCRLAKGYNTHSGCWSISECGDRLDIGVRSFSTSRLRQRNLCTCWSRVEILAQITIGFYPNLRITPNKLLSRSGLLYQ